MTNESGKLPAVRLIAFYVGIFMVFVYAAMGLMLIFTNVFIELIPRYRVGFGGALLLYAVFRLFMALRLRKSGKTLSGNE